MEAVALCASSGALLVRRLVRLHLRHLRQLVVGCMPTHRSRHLSKARPRLPYLGWLISTSGNVKCVFKHFLKAKLVSAAAMQLTLHIVIMGTLKLMRLLLMRIPTWRRRPGWEMMEELRMRMTTRLSSTHKKFLL